MFLLLTKQITYQCSIANFIHLSIQYVYIHFSMPLSVPFQKKRMGGNIPHPPENNASPASDAQLFQMDFLDQNKPEFLTAHYEMIISSLSPSHRPA